MREKAKKKKKPDLFDTAALHLLHDPQGFAERLMTQVEKTTERFEVRSNLVIRSLVIRDLVIRGLVIRDLVISMDVL